MGQRFGHEFGDVRVHDDARSAESARAVGATAYTVGRDVVFDAGLYAPHTPAGSQLLTHELAHVLQQRGAADHRVGGISNPGDAAEREAVRSAEGRSGATGIVQTTAVGLFRQEAPRESNATPTKSPEPTWGQYVDRYDEVYYDIDYRPAQPGHLSKWLRVRYPGEALIDINIDEISEVDPPPERMIDAMRRWTLGRGDRIFPAEMNRGTTPRLYAARRSALEAMDEYNVQFMMATVPAVLFIITLAAAPVGIGGRGGVPRATRQGLPRRQLPPAAGGATNQSAEQIGAEIGRSVAGQATGKMAAISQQVTARGLAQPAAATATESAVRELGLRTARVLLPDGSVAVTSVIPGASRPILVVRPNGSVFQAVADIVVEGLTLIVRNVTPI